MAFAIDDMGGWFADVEEYLMDLAEELRDFRNKSPEQWIESWGNIPTFDSVFGKIQHIEDFRSFVLSLPTADHSQPTAAEALTTPQGDYAPIDNPAVWQQIESTLSELNAEGKQLQADALLDEHGNPSLLLQRAIVAGKAPALFTYDNWVGAHKEDLQATLRALPEKVRQKIPNRQQLLAALSRDEQTQERSR